MRLLAKENSRPIISKLRHLQFYGTFFYFYSFKTIFIIRASTDISKNVFLHIFTSDNCCVFDCCCDL